MAKGSQRRPVRYEKDQLGCMWGLISIFDFRYGRSTQRLLSDRRHESKHANGAGNRRNKPALLTFNENCQEVLSAYTNPFMFLLLFFELLGITAAVNCLLIICIVFYVFQDGEESRTAAANAGKPSVKKLIEEEMISEQDSRREINDIEVEPKDSDSEQGSHKKKTRKRLKRNRKKSCDSTHDLDSPGNLKSEQPGHQNSEYEFMSSLDIDNIMEEFCLHIRQKSIDYVKHDQPGELHVQSNLKNPDFEEKLKEAIKLLTSQKLVKGKHFAEDGEFHPSKELMDALQILGSDRELFVKHLQDPNSPLVKSIQNFPDEQLEKDKDSKSLAETNLLDRELGNPRQSDELVNRKQRKFLRRKVKSQGKSPSNEDKTSQASNRIVILKPGPAGMQNQETAGSVGLSPESHYIIRNKGTSERYGSHFFLTEIKRRLKNAMGKEHQRISTDSTSKGSSYERQNVGDRNRGTKENIGMSSPSKDHFFMEKIARPISTKKGDKTGKLKDDELNTERKTADLPNQRASNIYLEAKKHLSEMLSNGDENPDSSSGRIPRTLGRILSLPEYNFSPVGSPGRNWDPSFVTAQMRFFDTDNSLKVNESASSLEQGSHVDHLGQIKEILVTQPCISDDGTDNKGESPNLNSNILNEQIHDIEVEKISLFIGDEMGSKGDVDVVKTNGIVVEEENNVLDAPCEPSSSSSIKDDDKNGDESEICYAQRDSRFMKQDSSEENHLPSSPLASPSNSPIPKKVEDHETPIDILERPSPVSVLEPLFADDDISPASTTSNYGEISMQPLRIKFEEHEPSTEDQIIQVKSSMEDKESIYKYVKAVLQASGLNWDELCIKLLSTDELIDPSFSDEVEFVPSKFCYEQKLLFDCINEALMEICGHYFGCSPWVSFAKPYIRPVPNMENVLGEVWEGVSWHLLPLPISPTLDQTVRKDMAKSGTWMDLRYDTDTIAIEMGDDILDDLMEDTVLSCVFESLEIGCPELTAELMESGSSINLNSGCPMFPVESNGKEEQHLLVN
ncbi:hypothetical protein Ddye_017780 [Dipteronia dyeriana]|uniref:DUF4378 domain-containing protein n=1 Tax=Dipteronia dyeriana TaxID=168575 RepID=A0AAD9U9C8_9ROSI|nr:hypothetical protein Ddye_017780 [Dipteronia dyeriana]